MIDIELQFQVRNFQFLDQIAREAKVVEKIMGRVARIERLEHNVDAVGRDKFRCPRHRFAKCSDRLRILAIGQPRHQMQALDAGRLRVRQRRAQALLQIGKTLGQRRKTLFARVPITRRQIKERLRQAVAMQPLADLFGRVSIGKQKLDRGKASLRRRLETIEERHLVKHEREIGGKTGHPMSSCYWISTAARRADACRSRAHTFAPPTHRRRGPCRKPPSSETFAGLRPRPAPGISPIAPCPG